MPCIMAQKSVSSGISRKSATSDTHRTTARGGVNTAAGSATEVKNDRSGMDEYRVPIA